MPELFHRYEGNPILTADKWPYPANTVMAVACGNLREILQYVLACPEPGPDDA